MEHIIETLSQLNKILKCKVALFIDDKIYFYPSKEVLPSDGQALQGYDSWDIEATKDKMVFYTENSTDITETAIDLAALHIKSQLNRDDSLEDSFIKLLTGAHNYSDIAALKQFIREEDLYLIVVSGTEVTSIEDELVEIIRNSINTRYIAKHQGNLIALVQEQDINQACNDLQKNILTELYVEVIITIGGKMQQPQQLGELYNNCIEAMLLKESYGINQKLLDFQSMLIYRVIASVDKDFKDSIVERVFGSRFSELLNSEMELTIEEMFKNNLNLTDTSARLYIHRNTLLYRIDKIYKLTGFDLRKFEDSMIFKMVWLMHKEK